MTRRPIRELLRATSGVSVVEFALILPIMTAMGMYGIEIAYMSSVNMAVSQLAEATADNASRMEQTSNNSVAPTVTEADVNSILTGVTIQSTTLNFATRGKVIITSLEKDPATGKQFIHWQRCSGSLAVASAYGNDSNRNGLTGTPLVGMGQGATKITAGTGVAVMFVEIFYDYHGLFGTLFVKTTRFRQEAAYIVRDVRDLRLSNQSGITGTGFSAVCT